MISPEDFVGQVDETKELKATIQRLTRKLNDKERKTKDYVDAIYQAAKDAALGLTIDPVVAPARDPRRKNAEVAVPLVSDLQLGKVTPTYNSDIAALRMALYADKIREMTEIQRSDHPVKSCHVAFLGDIIEGVDIFPGQAWLIDSGLYRQVMINGRKICVEFLRQMLSIFEEVRVTWVIGNHGRIGRNGQFDPESNSDRMLGTLVEMLFENEPRISFNVPDGQGERNWYAILKEGEYSALLFHGDQIHGQLGFPYYGLGKKVNGWASGAIPEHFTDCYLGHFHMPAQIPLNDRMCFVNGTLESYNTYAQENMASMGKPRQWLNFVSPVAGRVTASYLVNLTE